jgi:hypothetical protein
LAPNTTRGFDNKEELIMKTLMLMALAAGSLTLSVGCAKNYQLENDFGAAPGYSSSERYQTIYRAWDYEGRQAVDDLDHILLLRPPSRLTLWNVQ